MYSNMTSSKPLSASPRQSMVASHFAPISGPAPSARASVFSSSSRADAPEQSIRELCDHLFALGANRSLESVTRKLSRMRSSKESHLRRYPKLQPRACCSMQQLTLYVWLLLLHRGCAAKLRARADASATVYCVVQIEFANCRSTNCTLECGVAPRCMVCGVDVCVLDVSLVGALSEQQEPFVGNLGLLKGAHRLNDARGR